MTDPLNILRNDLGLKVEGLEHLTGLALRLAPAALLGAFILESPQSDTPHQPTSVTRLPGGYSR